MHSEQHKYAVQSAYLMQNPCGELVESQSLHVKEQDENRPYFGQNVNVLASKLSFLWEILVIFSYAEKLNERFPKICGRVSCHCLICWIKVFQFSIQWVTT
jgi:hypothetical protein